MSEILHYGTKRHSGRYPWGSGESPYQSGSSFLEAIGELRKKGLTDSQIAQGLGLRSSTQLRAFRRIALNEQKAALISTAVKLKDKNYSTSAIGRAMGVNESTVRGYLAQYEKASYDTVTATANRLRDEVEAKGVIDVGSGTDARLGVNANTMRTALEMLHAEGYRNHNVKVQQLGTTNQTTIKVLAKPEGDPGAQWKDLYDHPEKIRLPESLDVNSPTTKLGLTPPKSLDSSRLMIRYGPEGGAEKDGVIEVRRGVDDISIGESRYAQVRVAVDGTHFLKGMAVYGDDLPKGVDVIFNTNKDRGTPKDDLLKVMKKNKYGITDEDNPFGSSISKQFIKTDKNGNVVATSVMNIVNEEGDWQNWSKTLSSQMLSKQSPVLAKQQLDVAANVRRAALDEIKNLTNPTVKTVLLESFADGADSAAVHLKAAMLPGQTNSVIIPVNSLKDSEIYAPKYSNGDRVVLVRHPHGGKFEIPELTVNNRNKEARNVLSTAIDAVGINSRVAERLSGADFDGDTVLVIPNPATGPSRVSTRPALEGLKNFNPRSSYPGYDGMPKLEDGTKQRLMGDVSNLITDMTIKGANESEIAQAVRHSMVVIDAEKHNLDYKKSAEANGISALKAKYQGKTNAGASTLVSLASSDARVPARTARRASDGGPIDPKTGEKVWTTKPNNTWTKVDPETGVATLVSVPPPKMKSTKMAETSDARTLISKQGTLIETTYASYANQMKAMANEARKEILVTKDKGYSPTARKAYRAEEARLVEALNTARMNAPLERQAQVLANQVIRTKRDENPHWDADDLKKARGQALGAARKRVGADKQQIVISDREWEAIQAGAISPSRLKEILTHADLDRVKELATPRTINGMPPAKIASAKSMIARGFTQAEVADMLGVSASTIANALKG